MLDVGGEIDELGGWGDAFVPGGAIVVVGGYYGDFDMGVEGAKGGYVIVDDALGAAVFVVLGDEYVVGRRSMEVELWREGESRSQEFFGEGGWSSHVCIIQYTYGKVFGEACAEGEVRDSGGGEHGGGRGVVRGTRECSRDQSGVGERDEYECGGGV